MGAEKTLVNVNKGQDAYSVIGNYILNHVTAIEDMIAVIQINGAIIKELYMVDVDADGYFYWESDWWEGEEDVALLDFFPVSDAERIKWIPCSERLPENNDPVNVTWVNHNPQSYYSEIKDKCFTATAHYHNGHWYWYSCVTQELLDMYGDWDIDLVDGDVEIIAWMPLPEPYRAERRTDERSDQT